MAAAVLLPPHCRRRAVRRCRRRCATAKLPPTSRYRAATTATVFHLLKTANITKVKGDTSCSVTKVLSLLTRQENSNIAYGYKGESIN